MGCCYFDSDPVEWVQPRSCSPATSHSDPAEWAHVKGDIVVPLGAGVDALIVLYAAVRGDHAPHCRFDAFAIPMGIADEQIGFTASVGLDPLQ